MKSLPVLRTALQFVPEELMRIQSQQAARIPNPGKWSAKQELGHLLDSAANNHQRIVRAQLDDQPAMPGYDGDRWVELHAYQDREWPELIHLWTALNQQLLAAAETAAKDSCLLRTCTIAGSEPLTIAFIFDDYVEHMLHHLQHIGVEVKSFAASAP
jgi:hypothetical protein